MYAEYKNEKAGQYQKIYSSAALQKNLVDGRIRICTNKLRIRMRIQEAQKHTNQHADRDPQHWY